MKKIILTINEFLQFRQLCERLKIFFTYGIKKGVVTVQADADKLAEIGY